MLSMILSTDDQILFKSPGRSSIVPKGLLSNLTRGRARAKYHLRFVAKTLPRVHLKYGAVTSNQYMAEGPSRVCPERLEFRNRVQQSVRKSGPSGRRSVVCPFCSAGRLTLLELRWVTSETLRLPFGSIPRNLKHRHMGQTFVSEVVNGFCAGLRQCHSADLLAK